jgi:hypothetical protein
MARKTKTVIVPQSTGERENRDAGKHFLITELDAVRTEKWATRALLAISAGGADIPPEVLQMGAGAVVAAGFRALMTMSFAEAEPLLDEMMDCIQFIPDPNRPEVLRPFDHDDIEEVTTIWLLRSEVVEIHTGFSLAAFLSNLGKAASTTAPTPDMSDTSTSLKS